MELLFLCCKLLTSRHQWCLLSGTCFWTGSCSRRWPRRRWSRRRSSSAPLAAAAAVCWGERFSRKCFSPPMTMTCTFQCRPTKGRCQLTCWSFTVKQKGWLNVEANSCDHLLCHHWVTGIRVPNHPLQSNRLLPNLHACISNFCFNFD